MSAELNPDQPLRYHGQRIVRTIGTIVITACAIMLVLGVTALSDLLHDQPFVLYWTWCLLLAVAAFIVASLDMILIRKLSKQSRRELFRKQFMNRDIGEEPDDHRDKR